MGSQSIGNNKYEKTISWCPWRRQYAQRCWVCWEREYSVKFHICTIWHFTFYSMTAIIPQALSCTAASFNHHLCPSGRKGKKWNRKYSSIFFEALMLKTWEKAKYPWKTQFLFRHYIESKNQIGQMFQAVVTLPSSLQPYKAVVGVWNQLKWNPNRTYNNY